MRTPVSKVNRFHLWLTPRFQLCLETPLSRSDVLGLLRVAYVLRASPERS